MRPALAVVTLLLGALPHFTAAQTRAAPHDLERFDVSGLPKVPNDEKERQILLFLRVHKKGDLSDATRIHMMLAEYYRRLGDEVRADDCSRQAAEAWDAANGTPRTSARSPGKPPFAPAGAFMKTFFYTDELRVAHTWEFYEDGTFSHTVSTPPRGSTGPTELGWYALSGGKLRLWQLRPAVDREVPFELLGAGGRDGAMLDGIRMKSGH